MLNMSAIFAMQFSCTDKSKGNNFKVNKKSLYLIGAFLIQLINNGYQFC
jgi:hypothetical protein